MSTYAFVHGLPYITAFRPRLDRHNQETKRLDHYCNSHAPPLRTVTFHSHFHAVTSDYPSFVYSFYMFTGNSHSYAVAITQNYICTVEAEKSA